MIILGIETSCDETGAALYDTSHGLMAHSLHSQIPLHAQYGGVVPELASRDHIRKTLVIIEEVLKKANLTLSQINALAYVAGPGLIGALLVGASIGVSLAYALNTPSIAVHHMEAHLLAPMLEEKKPTFPFLALLVSGGHTLLVDVKGIGQYNVLGESLDDAAGEAFDKTAKLLYLPYPGGPALAKLALMGNPSRFIFPRPMTDRPGLDFSFSGLKTFAVNTLRKFGNDLQTKADIAIAFQEAVVDTFVIKCKRALKQTNYNQLVIAGGVCANLRLREKLNQLMNELRGEIFYPRVDFCTDNAAMVAYTGAQYLNRDIGRNLEINVHARWPL